MKVDIRSVGLYLQLTMLWYVSTVRGIVVEGRLGRFLDNVNNLLDSQPFGHLHSDRCRRSGWELGQCPDEHGRVQNAGQ
jgi:hypothetical protein